MQTDQTKQIASYSVDLINAAMGARRLTNAMLAESAGLSAGTVSAARNGSPSVSLPSLTAIANALEIPLSKLFADGDQAAAA